jgi:hypothetical protein
MIVGRCTAGGCTVLTIGPRCVDHDLPVTRTFTRGRPFRRSETIPPAPTRAEAALAVDVAAALRPAAGLVTTS